MTTIDIETTLGQLVEEHPARARVFERRGLDYCCHGHRSLRSAAVEADLDLDDLVDELASLGPAATDPSAAMAPAELIDHIVATHHRYLDDELPLLDALAAKVAGVHGDRHPELVAVDRLVRAVRHDLEPHLAAEEETVFPAILRHLDAGEPIPAGLVAALRDDHEALGLLLAELRRTTSDYAIPADACASYRSLYERLDALESDVFRHVHLENNVLFPALDR